MASPFPERGMPRRCQIWQRPFALVVVGIALCGCSFDLGSLMPEKEKSQEAPKAAATAATTTESAVSPGNVSEAQAHTAKAQSLAKSGEIAAALVEFNRAIGLDPYNAQALYGRALIYQGKNQHAKAASAFGQAIAIKGNADYYYARCVSYSWTGNSSGAINDCETASRMRPGNADLLGTLGRLYEDAGQKQRAIETYRRAIAINPNQAEAREGLKQLTK